MSRATETLPPDYFEAKYRDDPDPWRFETSDYERAKYDATLGALQRPPYASGLEIGCSIGVLTARLAPLCAHLLACDVSDTALATARARNAAHPQVAFRNLTIPAEWPEGRYDLVMLSEVVYYLDRADVDRLARRVVGSLAPGGEVCLVHWIGETDYPLSGDEATEAFLAAAGGALTAIRQDRTEAYRLDLVRLA